MVAGGRGLVEAYSPLMRVWLMRADVLSADADDLVQEVLLATALVGFVLVMAVIGQVVTDKGDLRIRSDVARVVRVLSQIGTRYGESRRGRVRQRRGCSPGKAR